RCGCSGLIVVPARRKASTAAPAIPAAATPMTVPEAIEAAVGRRRRASTSCSAPAVTAHTGGGMRTGCFDMRRSSPVGESVGSLPRLAQPELHSHARPLEKCHLMGERLARVEDHSLEPPLVVQPGAQR